jgi:hypothetical protein
MLSLQYVQVVEPFSEEELCALAGLLFMYS